MTLTGKLKWASNLTEGDLKLNKKRKTLAVGVQTKTTAIYAIWEFTRNTKTQTDMLNHAAFNKMSKGFTCALQF